MQIKPISDKKQNRKRWIGLGLAGMCLVGLCALTSGPMVRLAAHPENFRLWVDSHGFNAQLTYVLMVLVQVVVAVIPGEPLEIAGGYAFGAVEGTLLFFLGATLGSVLVFTLVRKFGVRAAGLFFEREQLDKLHFLKSSPRRTVLFLLVFMIPGTPKDLLCYFAGLTDMKLGVWLCICSFGRLPSLVTSTVGGDALGERSYLFAAAVFLAALGLSLGGLLIYRYICRRNERK